jgi:hypothetical protein
VYVIDYDTEHLATGVEFTAFGTFTITPAGLTSDNESLLAGARKVRCRLSGGTPGVTYRVEHKATTNESPSQTPVSVFLVVIT